LKDRLAYSYWAGITYAKGDLFYDGGSNYINTERNSVGVVLGCKIRYLYSETLDFSLTADAYHLNFGEVEKDLEISEETLSMRVGLNYTF
ncbi:hypothetical protein, partial [Desulfatiferula olefinivorans]